MVREGVGAERTLKLRMQKEASHEWMGGEGRRWEPVKPGLGRSGRGPFSSKQKAKSQKRLTEGHG